MTDRNAEWQRLKELYAAYTDEELLELAADRDSLTDDAQAVLAREMDRRRLVPRQAEPEPSAPEPAGEMEIEPAAGSVELITLWDMFSANTALGLLDQAEIEYQITGKRIGGDVFQGSAQRISIHVASTDEAAAQALLRREMGLFPLQEVPDQPEEPDEAMFPLVEVETQAEADQVLRLLREAGIEGHVAPPGKDAEEGDWLRVEVRSIVYTEALQVMTDGFISGEPESEKDPDDEAP
jgi:hypothetical protein